MEHLKSPNIPNSYNDWRNLISEITGGELVENGEVVSTNEPLVRGVETPKDLLSDFGRKINVRVIGDFQAGYTIRARGRWPFSGSQLAFYIAQSGDQALLAAERTRSKRFLFKPHKYQDDFNPAPKDESLTDIIPELDTQQVALLALLLKNTAITSAKKGLNNPNGDF